MIRIPGPFPVDVTLCTTRIVRVRLGGKDPAAASYLPEHAWPEVVHDTRNGTSNTGELSFAVSEHGIAFADRNGTTRLLLALEQSRLQPRLLVRMQVIGEQHFHGLGEGGPQFDRLYAVRRFWNYQANRGQGADIAVPLLISNVGYGLFFDSSAAATLAPGDGEGTWLEYASEADSLDLYMLIGDSPRQVLGDVATLLGPAAMPPRWALGYMQSTRHFVDAAEVRDLAMQFRARRLPCDALIFLSTYGTAKGWNRGVGHLEFEPDVFGEAEDLLAAFRDKHFHVITHEYPVLHHDSPLFDEAQRAGYLLDVAYPRQIQTDPAVAIYKEGQLLIDFSQPEARAWWWRSHRHLRDVGVAGWWLDGGEGPPASASLQADSATVPHNRYDLLRQQAFADGEEADHPDARPYLLCRSGGPGMQRMGAVPWSGDINATFASLELQIRTGLNLGMSGVPHWGTDTGGFYRVAANDPELFVRWFQFSAFCSLFRGHGHVWRQHLPWSHGAEVEAICRRYLELRSRLMPYTYTLAWQARTLGLPTMRPLVLNYPDDPAVWDLGTQYLWGDDILVAPVTRKGATHWTVYLPAGTWHDFWTHATYKGPGGVTVEAPLDRLPLFVRGGAIIPQSPVMQYDGEHPADDMTLLVYPESMSSFVLYEDDGRTNAYRQGGYVETRFTCTADAEGVAFRVDSQTGNDALIDAGRRYTLRLFAMRAPRSIKVNNTTPSQQQEWSLEGGQFIDVRMTPGPCTADIVW